MAVIVSGDIQTNTFTYHLASAAESGITGWSDGFYCGGSVADTPPSYNPVGAQVIISSITVSMPSGCTYSVYGSEAKHNLQGWYIMLNFTKPMNLVIPANDVTVTMQGRYTVKQNVYNRLYMGNEDFKIDTTKQEKIDITTVLNFYSDYRSSNNVYIGLSDDGPSDLQGEDVYIEIEGTLYDTDGDSTACYSDGDFTLDEEQYVNGDFGFSTDNGCAIDYAPLTIYVAPTSTAAQSKYKAGTITFYA